MWEALMARTIVPEKVEEAKEKIISATMDLIIQDGFSKLSLANVAKKAGITKAAIYWYFPCKDELINAMTASLKAKYIDSAKQIASLQISPKQKIEMLFSTLEDGSAQKTCLLLTKAFLELQSSNDKTKIIIQESYKEYIEIVSSIFDDAIKAGEIKTGLSSRALTRIFSAALDGCIIHNEMFENKWIDFAEVKNLLLSGGENS